MTVTPAFVDRVESLFGARLSITFGMTETCGAVLQTAPTDPDRMRRETVGAPLAGTDVPDRAPGRRGGAARQAGELRVRGARASPRGYLDDPAATAEAIDADGWLHTGDLAEMDDDGACRVVGRLKDMIKTGGENVRRSRSRSCWSSTRTSSCAAVVGRAGRALGRAAWWPSSSPLPDRGPRPGGADRVLPRAACRRSRCPACWRVVDDLPMTASAKVQRAELRRRVAAA